MCVEKVLLMLGWRSSLAVAATWKPEQGGPALCGIVCSVACWLVVTLNYQQTNGQRGVDSHDQQHQLQQFHHCWSPRILHQLVLSRLLQRKQLEVESAGLHAQLPTFVINILISRKVWKINVFFARQQHHTVAQSGHPRGGELIIWPNYDLGNYLLHLQE